MLNCLLKFIPFDYLRKPSGYHAKKCLSPQGFKLGAHPQSRLAVQLRQSTTPQHHHTTTPVHTVAGNISVQLFRNYFIAVSLSDSLVKFSPANLVAKPLSVWRKHSNSYSVIKLFQKILSESIK